MPDDEVPFALNIEAQFINVFLDDGTDMQNDSDEMMTDDDWSSVDEDNNAEQLEMDAYMAATDDEAGVTMTTDENVSLENLDDDETAQTDDSDTDGLSTLPIYALNEVHLYRTIKDIATLEPAVTYLLSNVRVVGIYEYGLFKPSHRCSSHYIRDRRTNHKLLLNCNHTIKFPAPDSVVLLFGCIKHKEVRIGDRVALVLYIWVKFWNYVLNADQIELNLMAKALSLPTHIYKHTVPVDSAYHQATDTNTASSDVGQGGGEEVSVTGACSPCPLTGVSNTMIINQVELDEDFYYEFERLSNMEIGENNQAAD